MSLCPAGAAEVPWSSRGAGSQLYQPHAGDEPFLVPEVSFWPTTKPCSSKDKWCQTLLACSVNRARG